MIIHINNKIYNTRTAKLIGEWRVKGDSTDDPQFTQETLYRKKTGEYFLFCEGGAESVNSARTGHGKRIKGEYIQLLTYEEANNGLAST